MIPAVDSCGGSWSVAAEGVGPRLWLGVFEENARMMMMDGKLCGL